MSALPALVLSSHLILLYCDVRLNIHVWILQPAKSAILVLLARAIDRTPVSPSQSADIAQQDRAEPETAGLPDRCIGMVMTEASLVVLEFHPSSFPQSGQIQPRDFFPQ